MTCPLCGCPEASVYHSEPAAEYFRCRICALVFLRSDQLPSRESEVERYSQHQNVSGDPRYEQFLRRLADPLLKLLRAGDSGLDYGCGSGPVMAEIFERSGFHMSSYDPIFFPDTALLERSYNFITCSEVMEHVHYPTGTFALLNKLMKPGGKLAIMTRYYGVEAPFATWHYRRDPTHVRFYNRDTMFWAAREFNWLLEFPAANVAIFSKVAAGVYSAGESQREQQPGE